MTDSPPAPRGADRHRPDRTDGVVDASEAAFLTALVTQHRQPLLDYVQRLLHGDLDQAEDVVQETLLRASVLAPQLSRQPTSPRPWLFRVARNIVIDWYRRQQARPVEVRDEELMDSLATGDAADEVVTRRYLFAAMAVLSPAQREVLLRLHFLGQTGQQIAAQLGVPVPTVKSRSQSAAERLRRILHDEMQTPSRVHRRRAA
jgi:RNA polymerase sigma-70 factor (ECF subfamily)